jgi:hypothetical protein
LAYKGSVGGFLEGEDNVFVLPLDILLYGFEVLAGNFVGESEEWLILVTLLVSRIQV